MRIRTILSQIFFIFLVLSFSEISILLGKDILIHGTVRHANTYQEIPYVNIYVKNGTTGTSSNPDGTFKFHITEEDSSAVIVFEHVSFDTMQIALSRAKHMERFYLIPRLIQSNPIAVEAERNDFKIRHDIPQPHSLISSKNFELQGYMDAGDLLKNDKSIQVEEELSGKKTLSMRAGNPDDVIILYNGIKMNSLYDNIFDLSLINIEDIRYFEIIRGSNTSLYGPEAFSGVINIVPKMQKNYNIRFTQRIGTYASGDWNLHLNYIHDDRFSIAYAYKQGATKREYAEENNENRIYLTNNIHNHSGNFMFYLDEDAGKNGGKIGLLLLQSGLKHQNDKFDESLKNSNTMASLYYEGGFWRFNQFNMSGAYQWYNRFQDLTIDTMQTDRNFHNRTFNFNLDNKIQLKYFDFFFAYQFEKGELDFNDNHTVNTRQNIGIKSALFKRNVHGIASIFKFHVPTNSEFLKTADLDLSYRYDYLDNERNKTSLRSPDISAQNLYFNPDHAGNENWSESTFKFSSHFLAENRTFRINSYMNFGSNVKFPSLFQQISSPALLGTYDMANTPKLEPEKNRSLEIGTVLVREVDDQSSLNGWQMEFNYFNNFYENKFRTYYTPAIPVAFYDNVQDANISGIESGIKLFMVKKKITFDMGISKYFISEKAAFPFKSDLKYVINFQVDHAGYSLKTHGFYENEQSAWIRNNQNEFWEVKLAGYSNLDVHLSKTIEIKPVELLFNLSARNIFDNDTMLEGIAIRDRRFYITLGIQY